MVPTSVVHALALLYFYVSTFRSVCAVLNMAVFCSSFTSWFPGMLIMYFLNDFENIIITIIIIIIIIIIIYISFTDLPSWYLSPWSSGDPHSLRFKIQDCATSCIMWKVPSMAEVCAEYTEYYPVTD